MSVSLTRRSKVLLALVASMTLGCGLLLGMRPPHPIQAPNLANNPESAMPLAATTATEQSVDGGTPAPAPTPAPVRPDVVVPTPPATPAWQRIVVHETGSAAGSLADLDRRYSQFGGCIYHFVIQPDGKVDESAIWQQRKLAPAELEGNFSGMRAIHIALVGQFDRTGPTDRQLQKVREKIKELATQYRISDANVEVKPMVNCPGKAFSLRNPF